MLLKSRRLKLGKGLRETARGIREDFDHTLLSRIEAGARPIRRIDLFGLAYAYEVPWEGLILALSGQLTLISDAVFEVRDQRILNRTDMLDTPITPEEKSQLIMYLAYIRFVQDRQDMLAAPGLA